MSIDDRLRTGLPLMQDETFDLDDRFASTVQRIDRRRRVRRTGYAMGLVAAVVVSVLVVVAGADPSPRSQQPAEPDRDRVRVLDSSRGSPEDPAAIPAGSYALPFLGAPEDAPWAQIDVPAGWSQDRRQPATGADLDPHLRRIELFSVALVAPDPCQGAVRDPAGPSVAELMEAIGAQATVVPGRPRPVSIDGYSGQVLQVRVPVDVDLRQCAFDNTLVPLWVSDQSYLTVFPGWTYRIWALDVDGHRLVVLAAHGPRTTTTELAELTHMIETLTFIEPR